MLSTRNPKVRFYFGATLGDAQGLHLVVLGGSSGRWRLSLVSGVPGKCPAHYALSLAPYSQILNPFPFRMLFLRVV